MPAGTAASATADPPCGERPAVNASLALAPDTRTAEDPYRERVVRESDETDKAAWAKLLAELLAARGMTPEQAASPDGPVSVNWRTLRRWLAQDQGVSAKSVRDVCRDLGYSPLDALVRVGFLTPDEAKMARDPISVPPPLPQPLRRIADVLSDDRVPDEPKTQLRRAVSAAFDVWMSMYKLRAPREPAARERTPRAKAEQ
jgi:hypothetical protein